MKSSILLLAIFAAAFTSCTTAYKTGQTPDDVYYSPTPPAEEYVQVNNDEENEYRYDDEYYDDRYLRMKVRNRNRWSDLDDWYYYGKNYGYSYYSTSYWNNPWTPYASWNNFYNPYCRSHIILNPGTKVTYNKPRTFNLNTYNNNQTPKGNNPKVNTGRYNNNNTYTPPRNSNTNSSSRNGSNSGNILRDIFGGGNNSSGSSKSSGSSSNSSSSSSSSGSKSSSSSGGNAPVRKF